MYCDTIICSQINTAEKYLHKDFEIISESSNLQCPWPVFYGTDINRLFVQAERKALSGIGLCETASASLGLQTSKPCLYTDHE